MIKKLTKVVAHTANIAALCAMIGIGAYQIREAHAQEILNGVPAEELHCLQQNIYFEARNQSTLGQVAVAWVTMNRVESSRYPDTICGVVWQDRQFSWTHDGKSDEPGTNAIEQQAWHDAGIIAQVVLLDRARDLQSPVEDATMFHADYVNPYWADEYERVAQIDTHIFYQ